MKKLFTLIAVLVCVAPAFADDTEVVVKEETQEEVGINQGCGCGKGKPEKPKDPKPPQ